MIRKPLLSAFFQTPNMCWYDLEERQLLLTLIPLTITNIYTQKNKIIAFFCKNNLIFFAKKIKDINF